MIVLLLPYLTIILSITVFGNKNLICGNLKEAGPRMTRKNTNSKTGET
jgi:hypothetical protein